MCIRSIIMNPSSAGHLKGILPLVALQTAVDAAGHGVGLVIEVEGIGERRQIGDGRGKTGSGVGVRGKAGSTAAGAAVVRKGNVVAFTRV